MKYDLSIRAGVLISVPQFFQLVRPKEVLERGGGSLRIFGVVQILLQVGLAIYAIVLVKPGYN